MNNYHIYQQIGKGKHSVVYKGRKKKTIEYMAVKSLQKVRKTKMMYEVKIFQKLNHPNILKYYIWHETRNHLWMIFQYCAGGDLMTLIQQDKTLAEQVVRLFGIDLLSGMQYMHSHGIIFCDVKPSNILLNQYGMLKYSDFGNAKNIVDLIANTGKESGSQKGTPCYMAPELFQDQGVYSFQSDFWGLGCIFHELAVGKPPFVSSSFQQLVNLIIKADFPKIEKFSNDFNSLIKCLLEKDPLKRPTWDQLLKHPFWNGHQFANLPIQEQPHFDTWVQQYWKPKLGATPEQSLTSNISGNSIIDTLNDGQGQNGGDVNVLRLSLNVKQNLQREDNGYLDKNQENDVNLANVDQEVDLGDGQEEQDDMDNNVGGSGGDDGDNDQGLSQNTGQINNDHSQFTQQNNPSSVTPPVATTPTVLNKSPNNLLGGDQSNTKTQEETKDFSPFNQTTKNGAVNEMMMKPPETPNTRGGASSNMGNESSFLSNYSNISGNMTPVAKVQQVPLQDLFTHNTDNAVQPIIGNREIEKTGETTYNQDQLPFLSYSPEEVISAAETTTMEEHFESIYTALVSNNASVDQHNVLNYFESIIQHSNVSNMLINSAFMSMLLKMLKTSKVTNIKIRLTSIIGLLIRHATVIENELSQLGIPNLMIELSRDSNEKVRRRAMAALGEYLFYGATQIDDDPSNVVWEMSTLSYSSLIQTIKNNTEDEITRFYAAKTIENITAQSQSTGVKFANNETAGGMIGLFLSTKNEQLKICAIVSVTHICVLQNNLIEFCMGSLLKDLKTLLIQSNNRIQQALISLINMHVISGNSVPQYLIDDGGEMFNILVNNLLQSPNIVIRGKVVLMLLMILKINQKLINPLCQTKFFQIIEKLVRDNYKYVQQCLQHFLELLEELIPFVIQNVADELVQLQQNSQDASTFDIKEYNGVNANQSNQQNSQVNKGQSSQVSATTQKLKGNLAFLNVLYQMVNSAVLRQKIFTIQYLEAIFNLVQFCEMNSSESSCSVIAEDVKSTIILVFENLITQSKYLLSNQDFILQIILPQLTSKLLATNGSGSGLGADLDFQFNCLKLIIDTVTQFMSEPNLYDVLQNNVHQSTTQVMNDFILKNFVPNFKTLLSAPEPMPFYVLKFIALILDQNIAFVGAIKKSSILPLILDSYSVDNQKLSKNTLRIVCQTVESYEITLDELVSFDIPKRTNTLLKHYYSLKGEWAYEDLLQIIYAISNQIIETVKAVQPGIPAPPSDMSPITNPVYIPQDLVNQLVMKFEYILESYPIVVDLTGNSDFNVSDRAASLILTYIYLFYASQRKDDLMKIEYLLLINSNIVGNLSKYAQIMKNLQIFDWSFQLYSYKNKIPSDQRDTILQTIQKLGSCEDQQVATYSKDILQNAKTSLA